MARERSVIAGDTDYTGYPIDDIIRHLGDWRDITRKTEVSLKKLRKQAHDKRHLLESEVEVIGFCDHFIDMFDRYAGDFERLANELPKGVRPRHVEIIRQLTTSAHGQDDVCIRFKNDSVYQSLPDEEMRPLLDAIYQEARSQVVDYLDLGSLNNRLKTFAEDGV